MARERMPITFGKKEHLEEKLPMQPRHEKVKFHTQKAEQKSCSA